MFKSIFRSCTLVWAQKKHALYTAKCINNTRSHSLIYKWYGNLHNFWQINNTRKKKRSAFILHTLCGKLIKQTRKKTIGVNFPLYSFVYALIVHTIWSTVSINTLQQQRRRRRRWRRKIKIAVRWIPIKIRPNAKSGRSIDRGYTRARAHALDKTW